MFSVAFLTLAATVAAQNYGAPSNDQKVAEPAAKDVHKPQNLAEAYITAAHKDGGDAAIYYSTAKHGEAVWAQPQRLYWENVVDPRGAKLCGPKNEAGQHVWLYVADAGNADVGGYVNRYEIIRDEENPGKLSVGKVEVVYGDASGAYRPTDVSCDEDGNVWWNDEATKEIRWAKNEDLHGKECNHNACKGASFVYDCDHATANLQAIEVAGNWVYWSQDNNQVKHWSTKEAVAEKEAEEEGLDDEAIEAKNDAKEEIEQANNGVWRVAKDGLGADKAGKCSQCYGTEKKGEWPSGCDLGSEIEFFSQKDDGYVALAAHNNNIYAVDNKKDVYGLGANAPEAARVVEDKYSAGGPKVTSYVADAKGRGLLIVDEIEGKGYVIPDDHKAPKQAFELPADIYAYGVAYGASQEVEEEDALGEDSAVSMAVSAFAGLVAIAALF